MFSLLFVGVSACGANSPEPSFKNSPARSGTKLVLNNAILEQSSDRQNIVWKIKSASTTYSDDRKIAKLAGVTANLLQNKRVILQIRAEFGEVSDNGRLILLEKNIVAKDARNGAIVKSNRVEWRPTENLLILPRNFIGTHPNMEVIAQEGRYFTDTENLELQGKVTATSIEPALQLTSDRLMWNIPQNKVESPLPFKVVRYQPDRTVSDRLVADRGQIDLSKKIATLNQNIELVSLDPQLQIATDALTWDYQNRTASTEKPIQIVDRENKLDITGNRGTIDFKQQVARLNSGIRGINQRKPSKLYASELVWKIDTEVIEATGNVTYQQTNPQVNSTGEKAVGKLKENNIVVSSGDNKRRQVTSIISDPELKTHKE